jgi:hypothetical protein
MSFILYVTATLSQLHVIKEKVIVE